MQIRGVAFKNTERKEEMPICYTVGVAGRQVLTIHATGSGRSSGEEEPEHSEESSIRGARGTMGE